MSKGFAGLRGIHDAQWLGVVRAPAGSSAHRPPVPGLLMVPSDKHELGPGATGGWTLQAVKQFSILCHVIRGNLNLSVIVVTLIFPISPGSFFGGV